MQHQTTYYRTVPVSEKPKHPDLYHTLVENESLGIEGLPCHNNYIGDPNGGYWEIEGESKVTHYLEPTPMPDAERLRDALEGCANELANMINCWDTDSFTHREWDDARKAVDVAREALSAVGDGWVRCEDEKKESQKWWNGLTVNERQNIRWVYGTPGEGYLSENNIIELWKVKQNINR